MTLPKFYLDFPDTTISLILFGWPGLWEAWNIRYQGSQRDLTIKNKKTKQKTYFYVFRTPSKK